jgi:hypothetical protein
MLIKEVPDAGIIPVRALKKPQLISGPVGPSHQKRNFNKIAGISMLNFLIMANFGFFLEWREKHYRSRRASATTVREAWSQGAPTHWVHRVVHQRATP